MANKKGSRQLTWTDRISIEALNKDNPAYVLSMSGNTILPKCLSIKSVDSKLINLLQVKNGTYRFVK